MTRPRTTVQLVTTSLIGLFVINCVMLGALFSQVPPNPPGQFGPYIGATAALAAAALPLCWWGNKIGHLCAIIVGLMCLLSLGPQKFFMEPAAIQLLPAIILGSILSVVVIVASVAGWRKAGLEN